MTYCDKLSITRVILQGAALIALNGLTNEAGRVLLMRPRFAYWEPLMKLAVILMALVALAIGLFVSVRFTFGGGYGQL